MSAHIAAQSEESFLPTPAMLLQTARRMPDAPAYYVRDEHSWRATSWESYAKQVQRAARALVALGVQPGDAVCIWGFNRPEWVIMDLAAMMVGAVAAGIYWTSASHEVEYIVEHSGGTVLLVENEALWDKVSHRTGMLARLRRVVMMEGASASTPLQMTWKEFVAQGLEPFQQSVDRRLASLQPETLGTLIYTSGTTGHAKAVMLSHHNLWWTSRAICQSFGANAQDRLISYLPLAHIAEQQGAIHNHVRVGFSIYFAQSIDKLGDHLKEVHPTIFFGVPRVWSKMQTAIEAKLASAKGVKAHLAAWALQVGRRWHGLHLKGQKTGVLLDWQKALAHKLIYQKVQAALGFDQARILVSGAAPISPETLHFFCGLNLVIGEVYGLSEACGPISVGVPGDICIGSVGRCLEGTEVRIADDGEILARGSHVFQGYLRQSTDADPALQQGWLHTGDIGHIDAQGYLYVTARKKDILVTSGGKNITPANIESDLMDLPLVEHAVVCGDGRHFITALLTLKPDALQAHAQTLGLGADLSTCFRDPALLAQLQAGIDSVNERQARVAHVRKFALIERSFTIENGELTPTLKVKRKAVIERHSALVEAMYQASDGASANASGMG